MQFCGQILQDSFETYKTVQRSVNPEFGRKVDVKYRTFTWIRFHESVFLKLLNNEDKKYRQNSTVN